MEHRTGKERRCLYAEGTERVIGEVEEGRPPWVQPFEDLTEAEILERLQSALARMPKRRRAIFLAVRLDGASYAELAGKTGLTVRQVEREIAAALLQLDDGLRGRQSWPWWRRLLRRIGGRRNG